MSRDRSEDVAAIGLVVDALTAGSPSDEPTFMVEIAEQTGTHKDGRKLHVYARQCRVRPSAKMTESGVLISVDDEIVVLVPPSPGPDHVYTAIRVASTASRRAAASMPSMQRAPGMPQRRSGPHWR